MKQIIKILKFVCAMLIMISMVVSVLVSAVITIRVVYDVLMSINSDPMNYVIAGMFPGILYGYTECAFNADRGWMKHWLNPWRA